MIAGNSIEIINDVLRTIPTGGISSSFPINPGVLSGDMGLSLFYFHFSRITNDQVYYDQACALLNKSIDYCKNATRYNLKFGSGLGSFAWLIEYLSKHQFIEMDSDLLNELDVMLKIELFSKTSMGEFDQIIGANGLMIYFLSKNDKIDLEVIIKQYLIELKKAAVYKDNKIQWHTTVEAEKGVPLLTNNLGIPHGMTGTLLTLLNVKENITADPEALRNTTFLIKEIIDSLMSEKLSPDYKCCFPSITYPDGKMQKKISALAWCYGDLSTGYALLKTAICIGDQELYSVAMGLLKNSTQRTDCRDGNNLALCHGLMSVAYLFYKLYKITNDLSFKEATDYWCGKAVTLLLEKLHEYKSGTHTDKFFKEKSLLLGYPGTLLSLLSIACHDHASWDELLLLN
jgi:lantibiotic modifying enzyme